MRFSWIAALPLLLNLGGCSLLGLADIELRRCTEDVECAVFDEQEGLPEGCHAYYCQDGLCLRYPVGVERPDGIDNDCDGLIDEPSADGSQTLTAEVASAVTELGDSVTTAFALDDVGSMTATWWDNGDAWIAPVEASTTLGSELDYQRDTCVESPTLLNDPSCNALRRIDLESGCLRRLSDGSVGEGTCDFVEVALDLAEEQSVVASVTGEGCRVGQLRIGTFERDEDWLVNLRGPARRSNSYLGITPFSTGNCTGSHRPTCDGPTSPSCGAARPAVSALASNPARALVAWIGAHQARGECGGDLAPVEMLAAFVSNAQFGEWFSWVSTSNEGVPQLLGQTRGGGAPALLALEDRGWLAAFGDSDGQLSLHFVPATLEPPAYNGVDCVDSEDTNCPDDTGDRTGLEVETITGVVNLATLDGGDAGDVDHIAMAFGSSNAGGQEVGLTWRAGCGNQESILFRRIVLSGSSPEGVSDEGAIVNLGPASGGDAGSPAIAYSPGSFVTEGFERDGAGPATADTDGGWFVVWAESGRLVTRRIAELDGLALVEDEQIELASSSVASTAPALLVTNNSLVFAYHDIDAREIRRGELSLGPSH